MIAALEAGNDENLGPALFDDLQSVVADAAPGGRRHGAALLDAGALGAVMTGSGPTVVALARHMAHADQLAEAVPGSFVTQVRHVRWSAPSGVV